MSIWDYAGQTFDALLEVMRGDQCVYCKSELQKFEPVVEKQPWGDRKDWTVRVCQSCGWWKIEEISHIEEGHMNRDFRSAAAGALRSLDLSNIETPVNEIRDYLLARYEARFHVNPRLFEETVASVFRDHGYAVALTSFSSDKGIDVLLTGSDDVTIGVQVKRYKNSIKVSQIRELLGALMLSGITKGMFVTTSRFQRGVHETVEQAAKGGYAIDVIDGDAFFEYLLIDKREEFQSEDLKTLIERAQFTSIGGTGVYHTGIAQIYNPGMLDGMPGPHGPQDKWP